MEDEKDDDCTTNTQQDPTNIGHINSVHGKIAKTIAPRTVGHHRGGHGRRARLGADVGHGEASISRCWTERREKHNTRA
jgi:hypothetical protein